MQSFSRALTCAIAAAIASFPFLASGTFFAHWLQSWSVAWIMMLPVVMFAAPAISEFDADPDAGGLS